MNELLRVFVQVLCSASWRAFEGCNLDGSNVGAGNVVRVDICNVNSFVV